MKRNIQTRKAIEAAKEYLDNPSKKTKANAAYAAYAADAAAAATAAAYAAAAAATAAYAATAAAYAAAAAATAAAAAATAAAYAAKKQMQVTIGSNLNLNPQSSPQWSQSAARWSKKLVCVWLVNKIQRLADRALDEMSKK